MWQERGLTMVFVTHDSAVARRAQRIGVMKNGRLTFKKSTRSVAARSQAAVSGTAVSQTADLSPSDLDPGTFTTAD
jgi:ABC-type glutathione transport system ATPase component